jgi:hypothetical protein
MDEYSKVSGEEEKKKKRKVSGEGSLSLRIYRAQPVYPKHCLHENPLRKYFPPQVSNPQALQSLDCGLATLCERTFSFCVEVNRK